MKKPPLRAKAQKEGFTDQGLPTSNVLNDTVERVTPEKKKNTLRSTGITQDGRERLNTMLKTELKDWLLLEARKRRISLADVLEIELLERYNTQ